MYVARDTGTDSRLSFDVETQNPITPRAVLWAPSLSRLKDVDAMGRLRRPSKAMNDRRGRLGSTSRISRTIFERMTLTSQDANILCEEPSFSGEQKGGHPNEEEKGQDERE